MSHATMRIRCLAESRRGVVVAGALAGSVVGTLAGGIAMGVGRSIASIGIGSDGGASGAAITSGDCASIGEV